MNSHSGLFLSIHTIPKRGKEKELKLEQSDFPKADKYGPLLWVRSIRASLWNGTSKPVRGLRAHE